MLDLSKIFGKKNRSKDTAKDRLKLVLVHDRANVSPEILEKIDLKDNILHLYDILDRTLTRRESLVIRLRYGLYNKKSLTQREVADMLGISRSYVSRIEKAALEKLRKEFEK